MKQGAGGSIGVLVERNVHTGVAALVHQVQHPLAHAVNGAVVVGQVYRHTAAAADLHGLSEGVQQAVAQGVAGVGHVEPAVFAHRLRHRHQFIGVAVGAGGIGQPGGESECPVAHTLSGQVLHSRQFLGRWQPVLPAHCFNPDGRVRNEVDHVAGSLAVQQVQELRYAAPPH